MTEERKRRRLHDLVAELVGRGFTRPQAFFVVATDEQLRAGHVAASFYRVERELANAAREARQPVQLELEAEA